MTNEELIEEARQHAEDAEAGYATGNAVLYRQLADALETATSAGHDHTVANYDGSPDSHLELKERGL